MLLIPCGDAMVARRAANLSGHRSRGTSWQRSQETGKDSPTGWPQQLKGKQVTRTDGRPTAQWPRLKADRSDDLGTAPQVIFTQPEVAVVGLTEAAAVISPMGEIVTEAHLRPGSRATFSAHRARRRLSRAVGSCCPSPRRRASSSSKSRRHWILVSGSKRCASCPLGGQPGGCRASLWPNTKASPHP